MNSKESPGFTEPGNMFDILENRSNETLWQSVLSATAITKLGDELYVLTGNRIAEGNQTHINVASTPTMHIPSQEAGLLLADSVNLRLAGNIDPGKPFVSESLSPSVADIPNSLDVLGAKVGHLLALKLGLGVALERTREPIGRTSLARCIAGFSYLKDDVSGEPLYEPLLMLGAIIGLKTEVARTVPNKTSSYSHLGWTEINRYAHGVASKTLSEVLVAAKPSDELEVCVRGLCNATSSAIVSNPKEIQDHLTEDGVLPEI